jgi:2',3'-cyclic-nucleotide 2'-phosphodiesterase/3'-nucleotidase
MKNRVFGLLSIKLILILILVSCSGTGKKNISILETTDVHGVILPYDFIEKEKLNASLASVFTYVRQVREKQDETILLDDGDNLQGQPEVYYYNFIDTLAPHFL